MILAVVLLHGAVKFRIVMVVLVVVRLSLIQILCC
jgi:hypothetical protein